MTFNREYLASAAQKAGKEVVRYDEPQARTDYGPPDARPVRLLARKP